MTRLICKRPVFFFDRGHVAQFNRKIYQDGIQCYFGGWEPTQVTPQDLDPAVLTELSASQGRAVDGLLEYWSGSPTPEQVIDHVTRRHETV